MRYLVEYLPRIGSTSVVVSATDRPVITSLNASTLELKIDSGPSVSILLPHEVSINGTSEFIKCGPSDYVVRLSRQEGNLIEPNQFDKSRNFLMSLPEGKWTKRDLLEYRPFSLICLSCGISIIDEENCLKLNEMPSEFWMELMDYWHCHKPNNNDAQDKSKVYWARQNSLNPSEKEILVGGSYFLGKEETFKERAVCSANLVYCANCSATLGNRLKDNTYRINKYNLKLRSNGGREIDLYAPENDVVFTLLNCVKGNSTRHILLKCGVKNLLVWIFAIGIDVTLSTGDVMNNCMKVMYQDGVPVGVEGRQNVDDAIINEVPMKCFLEALESVNKVLPENSTKMGPWNVSYIPIII